jgi:hypothetical protein
MSNSTDCPNSLLDSINSKLDDLKKSHEKHDKAIDDLKTIVLGSYDGHPGINMRLRDVEKDLDSLAELQRQQIEAINKTIELNRTENEKLLTRFSIDQNDRLAKEIERVKVDIRTEKEKKESENREWLTRTIVRTIIGLLFGGLALGFANLFKNEVAKAVQQQQIQDRDTGAYYKEQDYIEDSELYKTAFHII